MKNAHSEISTTLQGIFGQETNCAKIILDVLLRKVHANFYMWSSEHGTTSVTAKLLLSIVRRRELSPVLLHNEQFWTISQVAVVERMPWLLLPAAVKKTVMKALVVSCSSEQGRQMDAHLDAAVLQPLTQRFEALSRVAIDRVHCENTIKEVMGLAEAFNGVVEGAAPSLVGKLMPFVVPRLQQAVQLLDVYHNYGEIVELLLCMFNGVIEK